MHLKVAAFTLACALISNSAVASDIRIASTSLCGDTYVLAIAPDKVSALSWQSRDPISLAPQHLRKLPQVWDDVEVLLGHRPTHVIFGPGEGYTSKRFLELEGITPIFMDWAEDTETIKKNWQTIYDVTGGREYKELAVPHHGGASPKILYLSRSGGTAGPGTYVDAAIQMAGGHNLITTPGWHTPDVEYLITLEPDVIVTSFLLDGYESQNSKTVRHKVLRKFIGKHPQIDIPGAVWPCAGPGLNKAAQMISDGINKLK